MRILMTADVSDGSWSLAVELCRQLSAAGATIALVAMGDWLTDTAHAQVADLPTLELYDYGCKVERMDELWDDPGDADRRLLELARQFQPTVVHLTGFAHATLPWRAPVVVEAHRCELSRWQAVGHEAPPPSLDRYRQLAQRGIEAAAAVVAPSRTMLADLERWHGPVPRARIIHPGRDGRLFQPGEKQPIIFTSARRWDDAHDLSAILRASHEVDWPIFVAGQVSGHGPQELTLNGVELLGELDERQMASWLSRASIYVAPGKYATLGVTVLEAALSGCALVLAGIPSRAELWHGDAMFVDLDRSDALARAVTELIGHPPHRRRLANLAMHRAARYSSQRMAAQYIGLYQELAREPVGHGHG